MEKKHHTKLIIALLFVFILSSCTNPSQPDSTNNPKIETINEEVITETKVEERNIVLELESAVDKMLPDDQEIKEAVLVAVVKITEALPSQNSIENGAQTWVYTPYVGQVLKVLEGEAVKEIEIINPGGVMLVDDYVKNISESEKDKILQNMTDTKDKWVKSTVEGNVELEVGKTYLFYLSHDNELMKPNEFGTLGNYYGSREIESFNEDFSEVKIMDPDTKEFTTQNLNE